MKKLTLLILFLSLCAYTAMAEDSIPCVDPTDSLAGPSFQQTDDDNESQNENEELQEYRPDTDQSEDNGNTNEYGDDGSDGSTKTVE
jgi:hypothetical protein